MELKINLRKIFSRRKLKIKFEKFPYNNFHTLHNLRPFLTVIPHSRKHSPDNHEQKRISCCSLNDV